MRDITKLLCVGTVILSLTFGGCALKDISNKIKENNEKKYFIKLLKQSTDLVVFGDFDNDGDEDAIVGTDNYAKLNKDIQRVYLFKNDGSGKFPSKKIYY